MIVLLTTLSALMALAFSGMLIGYLMRLTGSLEQIGGQGAALERIAADVQIAEQQLTVVGTRLTRLNSGLESLGEGLTAIDGFLAGAHETIRRQGS